MPDTIKTINGIAVASIKTVQGIAKAALKTFNGISLAESDPSFSSVSLLVHCDGTNGSTTFTDNSSHNLTVTAAGNANVTTTGPKFGTGALAVDGTGDWLRITDSTQFTLGTGDFTIEGWFNFTSVATWDMVVFYATSTLALDCYYYHPTTELTFYTPDISPPVTQTFSSGTYYHLAWVRTGTTIKMFVDGTQIYSAVQSSTNIASITDCYIGSSPFRNTAAGKVDDVRITKGVARYTGNFTPPTAAFPNS